MSLPVALSTESRKAYASAIATFLGCLALVMTTSGAESITELTQLQWITICVNTLAAFGITYNVPNGKDAPVVPAEPRD